MSLIRVNDLDDPRIADYRVVAEPDVVRVRGLFVAEGRRVVERLIGDGRHAIRSLLLSDSAYDALGTVLEKVPDGTPIYVCGAKDFLHVTGFNMHRGCLALAERPQAIDPAQILESARTVVMLDGVANADNVGGVFRNAAAFDVDGILLTPDCCDPLYRKAIRTSMAATLRVPFSRVNGWTEAAEDMRAAGFTLVALTPRSPSQPIDEFAEAHRLERIALVVGAEGRGLEREIEDCADHRVSIPINPAVDSLNLAVATGIALARLSRRPAL